MKTKQGHEVGSMQHARAIEDSELKAMLERLECLRETWADYAYAIETTYDDKHPAAKAMRKCIGDLYDCTRNPHGNL